MTRNTLRIVRLAGLGYVAVLTLLLLTPDIARLLGLRFLPAGSGGIGMHFSTFFGLAVLAAASRVPLRVSSLIAVLFAYAVAMELLQFLSPPRTVEWMDLLENLLGLGTGLALWGLVSHYESRARS